MPILKVYKYMTVMQLYPVANSIVVSGEGVEGTQLHPSFAQFGTGRVEVATDVGSGVGEAKQVKLLNTYTYETCFVVSWGLRF